MEKWKVTLVSIGITLGVLGIDILKKSPSLEYSIQAIAIILAGAIFTVSGVFAFISQERKKIQHALKKFLKK